MSVWANIVKHVTGFFYLLKEDGFFLLLETGDKIILEDSFNWNNQTKN
jgi:hypothetical protein